MKIKNLVIIVISSLMGQLIIATAGIELANESSKALLVILYGSKNSNPNRILVNSLIPGSRIFVTTQFNMGAIRGVSWVDNNKNYHALFPTIMPNSFTIFDEGIYKYNDGQLRQSEETPMDWTPWE